MNENFNLSIPYAKILEIKKENKQVGAVITITTKKAGGGYMIGFKTENNQEVLEKLSSLFSINKEEPYLGVPSDLLITYTNIEEVVQEENLFEDAKIVSSSFNENQNLRKLYAIDSKTDKSLVFNEEIGVCMESLPEGMTVDSLWQIMKF